MQHMPIQRHIAAICLMLATRPGLALHQGTPDREARYPAVVSLATEPQGRLLCSATKIGAYRLLTAAHCVVDPHSGELRAAFEPGGQLLISNAPVQIGSAPIGSAPAGPVASDSSAYQVVIADTQLAPAYAQGLQAFRDYKAQRLTALQDQRPPASAVPELSAAQALQKYLRLRHHFAARYPDVALVQLRTATPGIPTRPVQPLAPAPGTEVILVGFGCAPLGAKTATPMQRRWGVAQVIRSDAVNFYSQAGQRQDGAPSLCPGNSGGPVIYQHQVIGVNSVVYGLNVRQGARSNMAVNLAPLADWINSAP